MKVFFLCSLLPALIAGVPSMKREAEPGLVYGAAPLLHAPLLYHAPNCTSADETVTTKQCVPKVEETCEDVEVATTEVVFEEHCTNVTIPVCNVVQVTDAEEEAAEVVKREADPSLLLHAPAIPYIVPVPQYKCEDQVQEQCVKAAVVKPATKSVNVCKIATNVECTDVEHTVPRVTCTHPFH